MVTRQEHGYLIYYMPNKDIESLNSFVRNHMLEKIDVKGDIEELHNTYHNLSAAYQAIQQAETQLEILKPLIEDANKYEDLARRIHQAQKCGKVVPLFIAGLKKTLLEEAIMTMQRRQYVKLILPRIGGVMKALSILLTKEEKDHGKGSKDLYDRV